MSDKIEGGVYGVEIESDVAESLMTSDQPAESSQDAASEEPNGAEAAVENQPQETEQQIETKDATTVDEIDVDGNVYSLEDIKLALDDSKNRSEWQKSNTQKAQELSDGNKALESEREQWDSLRKDEELMDTLKDYLGEDHNLFKETVKSSESDQQDTVKSEDDGRISERIAELENKLMDQEAAVAVERDIQSLINKHPELDGNEDAVKEVLQLAIDKGTNGVPLNFEDAFVLANHETAVDSAFSKAVNKLEKAKSAKSIPEASTKHSGERSPVNSKPKDYDEARKMAFDYDLYG
tara:strand:+ start:2589 stop:3473 length:885 start_codon:yes stop_codon:yes gene_type:complete